MRGVLLEFLDIFERIQRGVSVFELVRKRAFLLSQFSYAFLDFHDCSIHVFVRDVPVEGVFDG
ncbi:hypothetical protein COT58_01615 [Candidatus Micrarchaeota archaeon CG09_land_8_20_14_0_10_60_16]|nr:MAG: hypothetical protein COT58_01615 [Candidatus Micrarchaeota archaeon CG09_land_8_20_14_0_10_60_16]